MASTTHCLASMARPSLLKASRPTVCSIPQFLLPSAALAQRQMHQGAKLKQKRRAKKKEVPKEYRSHSMPAEMQFSLCDAMRYLRAYEVGRPPSSVKYELAIRLKAQRNGPVIKSRIRLPHPVKSAIRIAVIAPEGSPEAEEAIQNGAVAAGETSLFEIIKSGQFDFTRLLCHTSSEEALKKANLGRILGPKGLMPSKKLKTVTDDIRKSIKELAGADEYRERIGGIRLAIGQMGYTPEMLSDNIKAFVGQVKKECFAFDEQFQKEVKEVVLASSHGPGFSLSGKLSSTDETVEPSHLGGVM